MTLTPEGGAAIPVSVTTTRKVQGGAAIPVYGYMTAPTDGRPALGGAAIPVRVLTAADLKQNGGMWTLEGRPHAMPVYTAPAGATVMGGPALAVYPVNAWPTVPVGPSSLLDGLSAYWPLSDVNDALGVHTLTNVNAATFVAGRVNNAVNLVGASTQYLWCNSTTALQTGMVDWTFAALVYYTTAAARIIACKSEFNTATKREWSLVTTADPYFELDCWNTVGGVQTLKATNFGKPVANAWYVVACGYRSASNKYWIKVNNAAENTATPTTSISATAGKFAIGDYSDGAAYALTGKVDEAGFWKKSLTAAELNEYSNNGKGTTHPFTTGAPSGVGPLIFDGDSLTLGKSLPDPTTSYPLQTCGLLGRYEWVNHGVDGAYLNESYTPSLITKATTEVDILYQSSRSKNVLCAWGGINDLIGADTAAVVYGHIVTYCQARQAAGFKVVVLTITPQKANLTNPNFEADRLTVNTNIRNNWATFADAMADPGGHADLQNPDNLTYFLADKIHLTAAGYTIVAGLVNTAIGTL